MEKPFPKLSILDEIRIEFPCSVPWAGMQAEGSHHYCNHCQKTIFDLTEMTTVELERLFDNPDESPCIRFARKPDGRIFSTAGPGGLRVEIFQRLQFRATWAASIFAVIFLPGCQAINSAVNSMYTYGGPARYVKQAEVQAREVRKDADTSQPSEQPQTTTPDIN